MLPSGSVTFTPLPSLAPAEPLLCRGVPRVLGELGLDGDAPDDEGVPTMLVSIWPAAPPTPVNADITCCAPAPLVRPAGTVASDVGGGGVSSVIDAVWVRSWFCTRPTTFMAWPRWSIAEPTMTARPSGVTSV